MKALNWIVSLAALALISAAQAAQPAAAPDGMASIRARDLDHAYVRPGADFARYQNVMFDRVSVQFAADWQSSINSTRDLSPRITGEDARKIADDLAMGLARTMEEAFAARGYRIVREPGPDVLRLSVALDEVYVNTPERLPPGRTRAFTRDAGEATLVVDASDSSGTRLGHFVDHRTARETRGVTRSTGVTSQFWFDSMFRKWANAVVGVLGGERRAPVGG